MIPNISGQIKEVILFDSATEVARGFKETGSYKGFRITNSSRILVIKCPKVPLDSFSLISSLLINYRRESRRGG